MRPPVYTNSEAGSPESKFRLITKKRATSSMPQSTKKHKGLQAIQTVLATLPEQRAGMPARDAITGITTGPTYTIIHTQEMDKYEKGAMGPGLAVAAAAAAPVGDNFGGTARKAAKLSIGTGKEIGRASCRER